MRKDRESVCVRVYVRVRARVRVRACVCVCVCASEGKIRVFKSLISTDKTNS